MKRNEFGCETVAFTGVPPTLSGGALNPEAVCGFRFESAATVVTHAFVHVHMLGSGVGCGTTRLIIFTGEPLGGIESLATAPDASALFEYGASFRVLFDAPGIKSGDSHSYDFGPNGLPSRGQPVRAILVWPRVNGFYSQATMSLTLLGGTGGGVGSAADTYAGRTLIPS